MKFRFEKRKKRILDALEKLGVAGLALALFQGKAEYVWVAILALAASVIFTRED